MGLSVATRAQGFTLLEIAVTVAILAILASAAVPSFTQVLAKNRTSGYTNDFVAALNLARSEAVAKRVSTKVCTSADAATCRAAGDSSVLAWASGWVVLDTDNNRVLAYHEALSGQVNLTSDVSSVTFDASGAMTSASQTDFYLRATTCINKDDRLVRLSGSGRISVFNAACA